MPVQDSAARYSSGSRASSSAESRFTPPRSARAIKSSSACQLAWRCARNTALFNVIAGA